MLLTETCHLSRRVSARDYTVTMKVGKIKDFFRLLVSRWREVYTVSGVFEDLKSASKIEVFLSLPCWLSQSQSFIDGPHGTYFFGLYIAITQKL